MPLDNETPNVRKQPQTRPEVALEKENVISAHRQAENDMEQDPDFNTKPTPEHDLDEGEIARFGNEGERDS